MNRPYSTQDEKDKFIGEHLLPYMVNHIEESDDPKLTMSKVASMFIFPYKTQGGIKIGSLSEPKVCWYFEKDGEKNRFSTGSYRIFADKVLKPEQLKKFLRTFGEQRYITEFSDEAVIRDLIDKMSQETDYSAYWWTCAYDVLKLWNPDRFDIKLKGATSGIHSNYFLFLDQYCSRSLKEELIEQGIFRDVLTPVAKKNFWEKLHPTEKDKALNILKHLGVPHSFIEDKAVLYQHPVDSFIEDKAVLYQHPVAINQYILSFIEEIGRIGSFPLKDGDNGRRCDLCHSLITEHILKESPDAFYKALDNPIYKAGMVVKNTSGEYIPLNWDLFYADADFVDSAEAENTCFDNSWDTADEEIEEKETVDYEGDFERLHVDVKLYGRDIVAKLANLHEFSSVDEGMDAYTFGVRGDMINFYKWVWGYSQHEKLVENILYYFSGDEDAKETVPEKHNSFVLTVLKRYKTRDKGYCFYIYMNVDDAFLNAAVVNRVRKYFDEVYCVAYGADEKLDVQEFIPQIVAATISDSAVKSKIVTDEIWDHIYMADGETGRFDAAYVLVKKYDNTREIYEDALIVWPSADQNSYIRALAKYVQEAYQTTVEIAAAESYDWKNEYFRLIRDIRAFVTDKHEIRAIEDGYGFTAKMNDVNNFGDEKRIWMKLKDQRGKIVTRDTESTPVNLEGWRDFLSAKYKGRCQLCGGKIAMGNQKSYFWTFRMVKESDSRLANLKSNLFCLCPACHGEMRYGNYMGKDMSQIVEKAQKYANYIEETLATEEFEDDFPCLIQELVDEDIELEGFSNPIVCDVVINGKQRHMAFSWEHFMRLAFIFASFNDFDEDEI